MRYHDFFEYANERQAVFFKKETGVKKPWTQDEILQQYRFCNVHREADKVTRWFKQMIREPLRDCPEVLLATFIFRTFNLPETGLSMLGLVEGDPYYFFSTEGWKDMKEVVRERIKQQEKTITGAYMVITPREMDKVDGCFKIIDSFIDYCEGSPEKVALELMNSSVQSLESTQDWLRGSYFIGPFYAYEIITDLRHTSLLENAFDINTWANPGPGAARGLCRMLEKPLDYLVRDRGDDNEKMNELMRQILSHVPKFWNYGSKWEMRDVEHTLCEFDKYERVRTGEGKPRSKYNGTN